MTITATEVSSQTISVACYEGELMKFFPKMFHEYYLKGESFFYQWMRGYCDNYDGGLWSFQQLSNGGYFAEAPPISGDLYHLRSPNGYEANLSPHWTGLTISLITLSFLSCDAYSDDDATTVLSNHLATQYLLLDEYLQQQGKDIYLPIRRLLD
ncbi:antirestriction protein [Xenorhabdus bovienii]|uniref:Antirestriction protein n=1 Tax=Xenorhabdus bovienii str. feltiae Moldova TaxID=1398200 RepID=A0A077NPU4_XENBV|nr:antirestriction protein [Xenorhabdus bovienii]CDH00554.1 hypothetical protein XBFM1_1710022 [Xenorhabdus bovienii str. feltiae Moldova]